MQDGQLAQDIEHIRAAPQVAVGEPSAALQGIQQNVRCATSVPAGGRHTLWRGIRAYGQRLVQCSGAFGVTPPRRMHQRAAERYPRASAQRRISPDVCLGDCPAQALQAGLKHAGADRGFPGLQFCQGAGPTFRRARHDIGRHSVQSMIEGRSGDNAQFVPEENPARAGAQPQVTLRKPDCSEKSVLHGVLFQFRPVEPLLM